MISIDTDLFTDALSRPPRRKVIRSALPGRFARNEAHGSSDDPNNNRNGLCGCTDNIMQICPFNNGIFASFARFLAIFAGVRGCGCLYVDYDRNFYFTHNGQRPIYNANGLSTQTAITLFEALRRLVTGTNRTRQNDEENFIRSFSINFIRASIDSDDQTTLKSLVFLELDRDNNQVQEFLETVIAIVHSLLGFTYYTDQNDNPAIRPDERFSLSNRNSCKQLLELIWTRRNVVPHHFRKIRKTFADLICYLNDLLNFLELHPINQPAAKAKIQGCELQNYNMLKDFLQNPNNNNGQLFHPINHIKANSVLDRNGNRIRNGKQFHCECRMLEHIFNEVVRSWVNSNNLGDFRQIGFGDWEQLWNNDVQRRRLALLWEDTFIYAIKRRKLVISRPCCFSCWALLVSFSISLEPEYLNSFRAFNRFEDEDELVLLYDLLGEKLSFVEDNVVSQITAFLGNSCRLFGWRGPSLWGSVNHYNELNDQQSFWLETLRTTFNAICEAFITFSGPPICFRNENSEGLLWQVQEQQIPRLEEQYGWFPHRNDISFPRHLPLPQVLQ